MAISHISENPISNYSTEQTNKNGNVLPTNFCKINHGLFIISFFIVQVIDSVSYQLLII